MTLRFGTDGVRGPADELTDELVAALGRAAASVLGAGVGRTASSSVATRARPGRGSKRRWLAACRAGGAVAEVLGVVPTPDRGVGVRRSRACPAR